MPLPACPGCTRTVIPKADDTCPNCGFQGVEKGPRPVSIPTPGVNPESTASEPRAASVDYGGFWIRLGAFFLDGLIVAPLSLLFWWISNQGRTLYIASLVPGFLFTVWFHVACVKRWGGTPGKLICGLRIVTTELNPAGWKEAWLRQSVFLALTLVGNGVMVYAMLQMSPDEYARLGFMDRTRRMVELGGMAQSLFTWTNNIWMWSEFIVLLTNPQRRALHDFIAGTLVVRARGRRAPSGQASV